MKVSTALIGIAERQSHILNDSVGRLGGSVSIGRRLPDYPSQPDLERMLRALDPDVLFVSTGKPDHMESTVRNSVAVLPRVQIILIDSEMRQETLRTGMQLGVRECLTDPFGAEDVRGALERSMTRRNALGASTSFNSVLYSFLPAKPGVGATTLATQVALNLQLAGSQRSLLIDGDLDTGSIQFLLQLRNAHSFTEALEHVAELDENLWPQLVNDLGSLDVLHAGDASPEYRVDLHGLQQVMTFARRLYGMLLVDLSGSLNRLSVEFMNQSKAIFLVTTTEVAAMHMARTRLRQLQNLQLGPQIRLIVNRVEKKSAITPEQIGEALGLPVHFTFGNEYTEVQNAILGGRSVAPSSALGRQIMEFAQSLVKDPVKEQPKKRRFLEVFSLPR